jgi:ATPase subunit of ABC transporter with duplicated ATPase domains
MAAQYSFVMKGLSKTFPGAPKPILSNIQLQFYPDAKIGIVGPNGSGKSTLMKIMAGRDKEFVGEPGREGFASATLEQGRSRSHQDGQRMSWTASARSPTCSTFNLQRDDGRPARCVVRALMARWASQEKIDAVDGWTLDNQLEIAMDALRCPPGDAWSRSSGGEKRRIALTRLLLEKPEILLLDEPTNHLDAESVQWLEKHLIDYPGNVILVTHDRYFLDNVVSWVLELDRGRYFVYESNYSGYLEKKAKRIAQEEREDAGRQKAINDELEWIRRSPKARQAKSKARIRAFDELVEAQENRTPGKAQILIQLPERLGGNVIDANLSKSYGDKQLLVDDRPSSCPPAASWRDRPNGAGKTTLFRLITGRAARFRRVKMGRRPAGYVDQSRDHLSPNKNVWERFRTASTLPFGKHELGPRLCRRVQLQGPGPAEEGRPAVGR